MKRKDTYIHTNTETEAPVDLTAPLQVKIDMNSYPKKPRFFLEQCSLYLALQEESVPFLEVGEGSISQSGWVTFVPLLHPHFPISP